MVVGASVVVGSSVALGASLGGVALLSGRNKNTCLKCLDMKFFESGVL